MKYANKTYLIFALLFGLLLVCSACSSKEEKSDKKPENKPVEESPAEEEIVVIPALSDERFYEDVHSKLTRNGFTVSDPLEGSTKMFGAESGMTLVVNNESLLPLHLYKLSSADQRLQQIDETGSMDIYSGSKPEKLAVKRSGDFIIYLHRGHPDYERIMQALGNE